MSRDLMREWAAGKNVKFAGDPRDGEKHGGRGVTRDRPEDRSQEGAIAGLVRAGYVVAIHSSRRAACADCGSHRRKGDGVTKGHGDYSITRDWFRRFGLGLSVWCNVEHKSASGAVRPEQGCAEWRVMLQVVRSAEEALAVGERFDRFMAGALGVSDEEMRRHNRESVGSRGVFLANWEFQAREEAYFKQGE